MAQNGKLLPAYIFQINEIKETSDAPFKFRHNGIWIPSHIGTYHRQTTSSGGINNQWWYFNGLTVQHLPNAAKPQGATLYKTYTLYFGAAHGFYVMRGDAMHPFEDACWHNLTFEHHPTNYSSHVCFAGSEPAMRCHNPNDATWTRMLLPDSYHGATYPYRGYGGLTGELPLFLGLMAFSMTPNQLASVLPQMCQNGQWITHNGPVGAGRIHQRGVVVSVYAYNNNSDDLEKYEEGDMGKYYG